MARRLASRMGVASRMGMAWRLASLRVGRPPLLWLRRGLSLLVDPVGFPPLRLGLRRKTEWARRQKRR